MRRPSLLPAMLAATLVFGGSAAAGQDTGSLIRPAPAEMSENAGRNKDRARQTMYDFARCAVKRARGSISAYLKSFPGSGEAHRLASRLATDECLDSGAMTFNDAVFRGAIYEMLYRDRYGRNPLNDLTALPSPDYAIGSNPMDENHMGAVALRRYADCIVRANPQAANVLIMSRAGTATEKAAFDAMMPNFSACLQKDRVLRFSKSILRGAIGETLFRIRSGEAMGG